MTRSRSITGLLWLWLRRLSVIAGCALVGGIVYGFVKDGRLGWPTLTAGSSSEFVEYCIHVNSNNQAQPYWRLRIPRNALSRAGQGDCQHGSGVNFLVSFPSMKPATRDMLDCVGDCNGLLWISLANETGDPWKIADRIYHLSLLNDGVLAKPLVSISTVTLVKDPIFTEAYETRPTGPIKGQNRKWYVNKSFDGRVLTTINCSQDTPQISCKADFSSKNHDGIAVRVMFDGHRIYEWPRVEAAVEGLIDTMAISRSDQ